MTVTPDCFVYGLDQQDVDREREAIMRTMTMFLHQSRGLCTHSRDTGGDRDTDHRLLAGGGLEPDWNGRMDMDLWE